jgi:hypothetical protein
MVAVLLLVVLAAYISATDGIDVIHFHGFGKECLIAHHRWHFHIQCGAHPHYP